MLAIQDLYIYPVKGLTPQHVATIDLLENQGCAADRAFAFLFLDTQPHPTTWNTPFIKKRYLAVQNDWAGLSALRCKVEPTSGVMTLTTPDGARIEEDTTRESGRAALSAFATAYVATLTPNPKANHPQHAPLTLVGSHDGGSRYPDRYNYHVSVINLASVHDLSQRLGHTVDFRRFRGNIIVDTGIPWSELSWKDETLTLGPTRLHIGSRIARCTNIDVHPDAGVIDLELLNALALSTGRGTCGMLGTVVTPGTIRVGDLLQVDSV